MQNNTVNRFIAELPKMKKRGKKINNQLMTIGDLGEFRDRGLKLGININCSNI